MTSFYQFAGEHPWLTFFLALIVGEVFIKCTAAVARIFQRGKDD